MASFDPAVIVSILSSIQPPEKRASFEKWADKVSGRFNAQKDRLKRDFKDQNPCYERGYSTALKKVRAGGIRTEHTSTFKLDKRFTATRKWPSEIGKNDYISTRNRILQQVSNVLGADGTDIGWTRTPDNTFGT